MERWVAACGALGPRGPPRAGGRQELGWVAACGAEKREGTLAMLARPSCGSLGRVMLLACCLSQHSPLVCTWMSKAKHCSSGQKTHRLQPGLFWQRSSGRAGHHALFLESGLPHTAACAWLTDGASISARVGVS